MTVSRIFLACAALAMLAALVGGSAHAEAKTTWVELNGQRFHVEIADTEAARAQGLMQRTQLDADAGMLFIFPDEQVRAFWMKNTLIPLDILYFDARHRLVSAQLEAQPCVSARCPGYASRGPARYVLEIKGGRAKSLDLKQGDRLHVDAAPGSD